MNIKELFSLRTVRKKIIMLSKIAGIILVISYIVSTRLHIDRDVALLLWLCFVTVLVFAIDYLLGRFISKPIDVLSRDARKMAQLDFSAACDIRTNDEFGELSQSLNQMSENLQHALSQLQAANHQLKKEVAQEKRLLAERKELVDQLSHEMKTPLGVIRAYAEGLQDETNDIKRQKYAEVIVEETARMSQLITTLLDLSALENGASQLQLERFDFVELLETVAGRLLIDSPDADFEVQYELPANPIYVKADIDRMEQVLDNLIVNAKSHVKPDGAVKLRLRANDDALDFSIFNQGAPIPSENLPKIWNKFYRDMNATYSGSGLGLAIVAQILSMHHFSYGVKNQPNGVEFYFSLPAIK